MKKEEKKPTPAQIKWTPIGSIIHGYEMEATYIDDMVVIRGCLSRARMFDRVISSNHAPSLDRILNHETYAMSKETVLALLRMFPKKEGKKK